MLERQIVKSEEDKIIGIEILDASKHVNLEALLPVHYESGLQIGERR